jgi:hypothetical protein
VSSRTEAQRWHGRLRCFATAGKETKKTQSVPTSGARSSAQRDAALLARTLLRHPPVNASMMPFVRQRAHAARRCRLAQPTWSASLPNPLSSSTTPQASTPQQALPPARRAPLRAHAPLARAMSRSTPMRADFSGQPRWCTQLAQSPMLALCMQPSSPLMPAGWSRDGDEAGGAPSRCVRGAARCHAATLAAVATRCHARCGRGARSQPRGIAPPADAHRCAASTPHSLVLPPVGHPYWRTADVAEQTRAMFESVLDEKDATSSELATTLARLRAL